MKEKLHVIENLLNQALNELYANDMYLIDYMVHERTIVFKLGVYLQNLMDDTGCFEEFDLDFEYNRNECDVKRLPGWTNGAYPDLIIHKRGRNDYNLLIMEFKPYWNPVCEDDIIKINEFVDCHGEYGYYYGKSILLGRKRSEVQIKTFSRVKSKD